MTKYGSGAAGTGKTCLMVHKDWHTTFSIIHWNELRLTICAGGITLEIQTIYFQNNLQMKKSKIFAKFNQNIVHKITTLPYFIVRIPLHSKGIIKMPSGH